VQSSGVKGPFWALSVDRAHRLETPAFRTPSIQRSPDPTRSHLDQSVTRALLDDATRSTDHGRIRCPDDGQQALRNHAGRPARRTPSRTPDRRERGLLTGRNGHLLVRAGTAPAAPTRSGTSPPSTPDQTAAVWAPSSPRAMWGAVRNRRIQGAALRSAALRCGRTPRSPDDPSAVGVKRPLWAPWSHAVTRAQSAHTCTAGPLSPARGGGPTGLVGPMGSGVVWGSGPKTPCDPSGHYPKAPKYTVVPRAESESPHAPSTR
jgi:hypothetical protein